MIYSDRETIISGKTDADLYRYAGYIFDTHYDVSKHYRIRHDMVQAAVMSVWKHREVYKPEKGNLNSWLYTMIFNAMRHEVALKRNKDVTTPKGITLKMDRFLDIEDTKDPSKFVDKNRFQLDEEMLDRILNNEFDLTEEQHSSILSMLEGETQKDCGKRLGISTQAVGARRTRAVAVIKSKLEHGMDAMPPARAVPTYSFMDDTGYIHDTKTIKKLAIEQRIEPQILLDLHRGAITSWKGWTKV